MPLNSDPFVMVPKAPSDVVLTREQVEETSRALSNMRVKIEDMESAMRVIYQHGLDALLLEDAMVWREALSKAVELASTRRNR